MSPQMNATVVRHDVKGRGAKLPLDSADDGQVGQGWRVLPTAF